MNITSLCVLGSVNGSDSGEDADDPEEVEVTPPSSSPDIMSQDVTVEEISNGEQPNIDQKLNGHVSDTTPTEDGFR